MKPINLVYIPFLMLLSIELSAQTMELDSDGAPQHGWQEVALERAIMRTDSRATLEQSMLNEARLKAVEQASGYQIRVVESMLTAERNAQGRKDEGKSWIQDYLYFTMQESAGRITQEKIPEFEELSKGGESSLRLHYRAYVQLESGNTDAGFAGQLRSQQPAYRVGDTIQIEVSSSRDAQLYLFNMLPDGSGRLIWPNQVEIDNQLSRGTIHRLPKQRHRYAFVAEMDTERKVGDNAQQELLFGILFNGAEQLFNPADAFSRNFGFSEINQLLLKVPRHMRTEMIAVYRIEK